MSGVGRDEIMQGAASARTVSFTAMKDGTAEDYRFLDQLDQAYQADLPDRILNHLRRLEYSFRGYRVSRLQHCLQCATRARRDGADADWVITALLHDSGDDLAPANKDTIAAAIIRPYVRDECSWVCAHHGIFQAVYYAHHLGGDRHAREKYANQPYYQAAIEFCERWDQASFDPTYEALPLYAFCDQIREVFARQPWDEAHLRAGEQVPLTG
jgi:predicted HD phosphohydrolase